MPRDYSGSPTQVHGLERRGARANHPHGRRGRFTLAKRLASSGRAQVLAAGGVGRVCSESTPQLTPLPASKSAGVRAQSMLWPRSVFPSKLAGPRPRLRGFSSSVPPSTHTSTRSLAIKWPGRPGRLGARDEDIASARALPPQRSCHQTCRHKTPKQRKAITVSLQFADRVDPGPGK